MARIRIVKPNVKPAQRWRCDDCGLQVRPRVYMGALISRCCAAPVTWETDE